MKKLISLALAIVMIMCLSTTAFATTAEAPGDYTAEVIGSYVAGNESNGIVYCVDITWNDLDFTYHAEKGAVWDTEKLEYSTVVPAKWEGEGTITVTNRSNTKISAKPTYTPADGYSDAGMDFSTSDLRVASAESGTAQIGIITVTPNGFLPAMDKENTIGTITLTIAQDADVTLEEAKTLENQMEELDNAAYTAGYRIDSSAEYKAFTNAKLGLVNLINGIEAGAENYQTSLNTHYQEALSQYTSFKSLSGL